MSTNFTTSAAVKKTGGCRLIWWGKDKGFFQAHNQGTLFSAEPRSADKAVGFSSAISDEAAQLLSQKPPLHRGQRAADSSTNKTFFPPK